MEVASSVSAGLIGGGFGVVIGVFRPGVLTGVLWFGLPAGVRILGVVTASLRGVIGAFRELIGVLRFIVDKIDKLTKKGVQKK